MKINKTYPQLGGGALGSKTLYSASNVIVGGAM